MTRDDFAQHTPLMRQYLDGESERHVGRAIVTGKDVRIGGSEGRVKATGQGVVYCIEPLSSEQTPLQPT